jgi:lysophospholipase L1-like esterase
MRLVVRAAALALLPVGAFAYAAVRAQALPANAPRRFVRRRRPAKKTVACLGASIIHGRVSFNVVDLVAERLGAGYQLVNAGVNGDLAYNARLRLPEVIGCQPDVVIVLVGSNDVMAAMSRESEARYRRLKKLPEKPTLGFYRENLLGIVTTLKRQTSAKVALCSLPVLGEALDSQANRRAAEYCSAIGEIAAEEQVAYLPIHEDMAAVLCAERPLGGREFDGKMRLMLKAMVERYVLGRSFDAIAAGNGFVLLSDGIHLNQRAGTMVADRIEAFVRRSG